MTATTTTTAPAVWIGCLACYNAGRLVGDWFPAHTASDVTLEAVHAAGGAPVRDCEELWVMDHEGFHGLLKGECAPMDVTPLVEFLDALEASGIPVEAYVAWHANHDASAPHEIDLIEDCREAFGGTWSDGIEGYCWDFLDEQLEALPEWVQSHRGAIVKSFAHDLEQSGEVWSHYHDGSHYVFRSV